MSDSASYEITVHPYANLMIFLRDIANDENNTKKGGKLEGGKKGGKAWVSDRSSQALASVFKVHDSRKRVGRKLVDLFVG